ncbi:MAG: hypothetical protein Kow0047_30240 [Anaerolineae bacterium]
MTVTRHLRHGFIVRLAALTGVVLLALTLSTSLARADAGEDHTATEEGAQAMLSPRPMPSGLDASMAPLHLWQGFRPSIQPPTAEEKWIEVDLSEQKVIAWQGRVPVRVFIVSTGVSSSPTVTGTFRIRIKTPVQDMEGGSRAAGDYYYLKDVPWVQYFYKDYSFHGTYWHNNFGRPMSHGCVNMTIEDAKWLFYWTSPSIDPSIQHEYWVRSTRDEPGTLVIVHE